MGTDMRPINRRNFIAGVAAVTAAGMGGISRLARAQAASPIANQPYTVREKSRADFKGTLRRVTAIGYRNFEFAGYGDLRAPELNQFLNELGATCCGTHEGFRNFLAGPEKVIEFNKAIGNSYVVVPSMPTDLRRGGVDVIRGFARDLNALGHKVKQAGMQLCYHNHSFEFESVGGGQTIGDILFAAADPDQVKAEVDVAWVHNAGIDPGTPEQVGEPHQTPSHEGHGRKKDSGTRGHRRH